MADQHAPLEDICETFAAILSARAEQAPERIGYTFVADDERQEAHVTYGALDRRARGLARALRDVAAAGDRALILLPTGPDYVTAVFGCLYAGVVAVPAFPVRPRRANTRIDAMVADCAPTVALTTRALLAQTRAWASGSERGRALHLIEVDAVDESERDLAAIDRQALAVLQYTSGSTTSPRGVMLSHEHLIHNSVQIQHALENTPDSRGVTWLPFYHDMGLIGGMLQPLFAGFPAAVFSPSAFMQRPLRWLELISRTRATTSGGPNVAYETCVSKIRAEEAAALDLSSWKVAFTGAEPVRAETLRRFADLFEPAGFRASAFRAVYGLAEATLLATAARGGRHPTTLYVSRDALQAGTARPSAESESSRVVVGCGDAAPGVSVLIVDPERRVVAARGAIGEIWLRGGSVAGGYWNQAQATLETFGARLADGGGPYLRTGDLGFRHDGEIFVIGRAKNVLIFGGVNYYAEDLEQGLTTCHPALRPDGVAAFSVEADTGERLVIVAELERGRAEPHASVFDAIHTAIADEQGLEVSAIRLIRTGTMPKTSSGKVQRFACRDAFLAGGLSVLAAWDADRDPAAEEPQETSPPAETTLQAWLEGEIARRLGVAPVSLDADRPLRDFGLDSKDAVALANALSKRVGRRVPVSFVYDHPTIADIVNALAEPRSTAKRSPRAAARAHRAHAEEPIAIVGMSCQFPGAPDLESFWRLLVDGRDAVVEVPHDRWDVEPHYDADPNTPGKSMSRWGGFLGRIDGFDPFFFGISPSEARHMDPQQRLLLEVTWQALADAGTAPHTLSDTRTGVFVGATHAEFGWVQMAAPEDVGPFTGTGCSLGVLASRISYLLNTKGPSLTVDTICSSSLLALHLACQHLRRGDCETALVGGINLMLTPGPGLALSKLGVLSPDGRCKPFDAAANGIVRGEGAACVVLKPLSQARADHDRVYAIVRGSAVNQDGRTNGIAAPNGSAQERLLREAFARAGIRGSDVQYVETHGTGTVLGDPIEAEAIGRVVAEGRPDERPCYLGSVKSNLGHLEAAGGIASLIKTALGIWHDVLPESLHFHTPNPYIDFAGLRLAVANECKPWPRGNGRALAGVTSLSFGGTNVHVVLGGDDREKASMTAPVREPAFVYPLSAHSPSALRELARHHAEHMDADGATPLRDIAYTAAARRSHFRERAAFVATSREDARQMLSRFARGERSADWIVGRQTRGAKPRLAFLFSGQGGQWPGMVRSLFAEQPCFRETFLACARALAPLVDWSPLALAEATAGTPELERVDVIQPMLWAMQVALAAQYRAWGVEPAAVLGHSLGEVAAAQFTGALSLDAAARVIARRSQLVRTTSGGGGMAVVELSAARLGGVLADCAPSLVVAAENGPGSCIVSGPIEPLDALLQVLAERGTFCRKVHVDYASHSPLMDPLCPQLLAALEGLDAHRPELPLYSTVTANRLEGPPTPEYWAANLRSTVRLWPALQRLARDGVHTVVEIGPHPVLLSGLDDAMPDGTRDPLVVLESLRRDDGGSTRALRLLGELYARGHDLDWAKLFDPPARLVSLPAYVFERERFTWEQPSRAASSTAVALPGTRHPMLTRYVALASPTESGLWEADLSTARYPYLREHAVEGTPVVPSAVYLELLEVVAQQRFGSDPHAFAELSIGTGLFLPEGAERTLQVVAGIGDADEIPFRISSRPKGDACGPVAWTEHVRGRIVRDRLTVVPPSLDMDAVRERCAESQEVSEHYADLAARGMQWGPSFRGVVTLRRGADEAMGWIELPAHLADDAHSYRLHPALLDAGLQVIAATQSSQRDLVRDPFLMNRLVHYRMHKRPPTRLFSHCIVRERTASLDRFTGDIRLYDESGALVVEALGMHLQRLGGEPVAVASTRADGDRFETAWDPVDVETGPPAGAGHWIIVGDGSGLAAPLATLLEQRGGSCTRTDDFEPVASFIGAAAAQCRGVLYLGALDASQATSPRAPSLEAETCAGLTRLVRAVTTSGMEDALRVYVVTSAAVVIDGDESMPSDVAQAAVWGVARVLATESPEHWGAAIDLDPMDSLDDSARHLVDYLTGPPHERLVCFRRGTVRAARLRPIVSREDESGEWKVRDDASYWITGGLGGVGREVAWRLAQRGARHLVLIGRTPRAAEPLDDAVGRDLRRLSEMGVRVHLAALDVADQAAVRSLRATLDAESWPEVRGVVHAAGVLEPAPLTDCDSARFQRSLRPKLDGARALDRELADAPLDFFVLMSSATAILGSPGAGAYAAANAALEAFAHARRARRRPALCVHWGLWRDTGMGRAESARLAAPGVEPLAPERALDALERLLAERCETAAVLTFDGARLPLLYGPGGDLPLLDATAWPQRRPAAARPARALTYEDVETRVLLVVARSLEYPVDRLDPEVSMVEMGLGSLHALRIRSTIEAELGVRLPVTYLLQSPSASALVHEVFERLTDEATGGAADAVEHEPRLLSA